MKLAEALQLRSDLQKRIAQLRVRLNSNALVQEGEAPAEAPEALLAELEGCLAQLRDLIVRINRTNCQAGLMERLASRDCLKLQVETLRDFLQEAGSHTRRATRSEIKILSTVSIADYQKQADALSQALRRLDTEIQAANWTMELL